MEPQKNVCWIYRIPLIGALTQGTMLCKCAPLVSVAHSSLSTVGLQGKPASNATLFMTFLALTTAESAPESGFFSVKVTSSYFYLLMHAMFFICFLSDFNFFPVSALTQ